MSAHDGDHLHDDTFVQAPAAMFVATEEGRILAANPAACRLLRRTEDELRALGRSGIIAPEAPGLEQVLEDRARTGSSRSRLLYVRSDGARIPVDVSTTRVPGPAGGGRVLIVAQDITEQVRAEKAERESQAVLRTIIDATPDFIWAVDPVEHALLWFNAALGEYFEAERGMTVHVGMRLEEVFDDPTMVRRWRDLFRQALAEGTARTEYVTVTGSRRLDMRLNVLRQGGTVHGISVYGRDVTEERAAYDRLAESESKYRVIVETMTEGVVFQAADGSILSVNPAAERIEEREPEDMLGKTSDDPEWGAVRADGSEFPGSEHPAMHTLRTGEPQNDVVMGILTPSGRRRWLSINSAPVLDEATGSPTAVVTTFHDITRRRYVEEQLRIASLAFDESQEAMIVTDADGRILRVNRSFTSVTGDAESQAVGLTPGELLRSGVQDAHFYRRFWRDLRGRRRWQGEIWNRRADGEVYPEWLSISAVVDDADQVTHYVGTFVDLSRTKKAEEDIHTLSYFDSLTGMPNRRLLMDRLRHALAASGRDGTGGALLSIDLDNIKVLNDTRGHAAGDALLVAASERLRALLPEDVTVSRPSSAEFCVLLEQLPADPMAAATEAERMAQSILDALCEPVSLHGRWYAPSAAVGVALFADGVPAAEELLKRADAALLARGQPGMPAVHFFNARLQDALEARAELEAELHQAVPGQLRLQLQPQVDVRGRCVGAEALVRWCRPGRGLVGPSEFIPAAERSGLIVPIGRWVLEEACRLIHAWQDDPRTRHLTVSVNVSPVQLRQPGFVDSVVAALGEADADSTRLKLELTESMLVDDVGTVAETMQALRAHGVGFSLDDFGTGYSSLSSLKGLPLDYLKIDRSFVQDLHGDGADAAFVRAIITLGQTLGLVVVAEGVETDAQRAALAMLGCDWYQGYLFSRPVDEDEFVRFALSRAMN